jgi:hypothetical protein
MLLVVSACHGDEQKASPPPAQTPARPQLATGTQADLARDLDDANRRGTWGEVRRRWEGQRYRWTVTRYSQFCASAEHCNVAAFPIQRPARHGWMPLLAFAPGEYDSLAASCDKREQCDFTFEGTLRELDATGERATKLRFDDVKLVAKLAQR